VVFDSHPPAGPAGPPHAAAFLNPGGFLGTGTSSFSDFLAGAAPGLLPGAGPAIAGGGHDLIANLPHGTTITAAAFSGGVVMAGDRRAPRAT
jgi:proteasome beta subunit